MKEGFERQAVISGIGQSSLGRRLHRSDIDLTVESALRAIADAGLTRADIDGLATFPGAADPTRRPITGPATWEVQDALRLDLNWYAGGVETPAQLGAVVNATLAVAAGLARHVLVYRTVTEGTGQGGGGRRGVQVAPGGVTGINQWALPYNVVSGAIRIALHAQRHFHEFGTTREALGAIAVNSRANAALNPDAVYREPLSLEQYLGARMIATPLCLYDCDVPMDGSTAVVVSPAAYAKDAPNAVRIDAVGAALRGRPLWDQWEDFTTMASWGAAAHLWSRTELKPVDVDVAELYDGFSIIALMWLEALGFCPKGEGGEFVDGGRRIALDGELPLNTHGGQLSAGRMHGFGLLHEACLQLRGQAGERQVAGAEVAVAAAGGGPLAGCLLLTR